MALRNILGESDPLLRKKTRRVETVTDRIRILVDDMWETMYAANGVGLAAPQVGVLRRIAVIDVTEPEIESGQDDSGEDANPAPKPPPEIIRYLLINPEVIETSEEMVASEEGCLSVPGMVGIVERPARVKVRAMDIEGNTFEIEGEGMLAKALLHEIDHLEGILYVDIAESIESVSGRGEAD